MIDIHTHLLNNVDDGSRGVIESLTSFKLAEKAGFTDIILTPHYIDGYYDNDYESTKPKIQELKSKLYDNNILINLHQGNEVYISEKIGEWIENGVVSKLGKSRYLLFELPQKSRILILNKLVDDIIATGCIPVLAHPERYLFVQHDPNELIPLIEKGVLMQSNYGSIFGQYGKEAQKTLIKMLKNNMVHFLGSDTHRTGFVYGHFDKVEHEFLKVISEEKFKELNTENPMHILEDEDIMVERPMAIKKRFFVFG